MKILVRLPNWLGDVVMSVGLLRQLPLFYPGAQISVVAKEGLHGLLDFFPPLKHRFVFSKERYGGFAGPWRFGREVQRTDKFDLYVSLPDSFSSALMGYATGAGRRIGYGKEGRNVLLTHSFRKPKGLHRAEEYVQLCALHTGRDPVAVAVELTHSFPKEEYVVVNINSEAASRRLTTAKAVEVLAAVRRQLPNRLLLIGAPKEAAFVNEVHARLPDPANVESLAGKTSLHDLVRVLASAQRVLTTDSGPAHLANALGTHTVVLFGAGNENNTAPYQRQFRDVLRLGKLSCEPCTRNVCVQFGTPQCLELLPTATIVAAVAEKPIGHG